MQKNNNTKSSKDPNISSAEMTALWRTSSLSKDHLSAQMTSLAGIKKAQEFIFAFNYPLVVRKVSVRAAYFINSIGKLISSGKYDACISFASGFSLLTYFAAHENIESDIIFIDSDLPNIILERKNRLDNLEGKLDPMVLGKIKNIALDLEMACQDGKSFKEIFPGIKSPIFAIEGVIYFLTQKCVDWIFKNISEYEQASVVFDYWDENGSEKSECFLELVTKLGDDFMPESIQSFRVKGSLSKITSIFSSISDTSIQEAEQDLIRNCSNEKQMLIDQNKFYPVRLVTAERSIIYD